jgi:hypothetical protein
MTQIHVIAIMCFEHFEGQSVLILVDGTDMLLLYIRNKLPVYSV